MGDKYVEYRKRRLCEMGLILSLSFVPHRASTHIVQAVIMLRRIELPLLVFVEVLIGFEFGVLHIDVGDLSIALERSFGCWHELRGRLR